MHEKKIIISAIIPEELYITREADRKLKEAVLRFSKPVYVSVARQMGKTNLLIHLKSVLESEKIRLAYIDMTNKFLSVQDCFRYIIDSILETNEELNSFIEAKKKILENRKSNSTSAVREYEYELKEILKYHKGNLVIILDEVDALRNLDFSDEIFAQIRKLSFSVVTTPSFKRATYVLSGVIEPKKLIKNQNNSPFNTAIPIKLNDFNVDEFNKFIALSGIPFEDEVKTEFYEWCKGNPRMTFDILSELEDIYIETNELKLEALGTVINSLYLTNYNHPPIDHIRDLIKHNTDARRAVIELKKGNSANLTDDIINKLYLYGIIASRTGVAELNIKNRIIEKSLSNEWLTKIELEKRGYFELAGEKQKQGHFREAIEFYNEYLENNSKGKFKNLAKYNIGESYHKLEEYKKSNTFLLDKPISKDVSYEMYMWQKLYIGLNFIKLDSNDEALQYLNEIIEEKRKDLVYVNALLNKGEILLRNSDNETSDKIVETYKIILDTLNKSNDAIEEKDMLSTLAYYRLGSAYLLKKETGLAKTNFEKAIVYAENYQKPLIYINIDGCLEDKIEKEKIYKELSNFIIDNNLVLAPDKEIINFSDFHIITILINTYGYQDIFEPFFTYAINTLYSNKKAYELKYEVAVFALNSGNQEVCLQLLYEIEVEQNVSEQILLGVFQLIGLLDGQGQAKSYSYLIKYAKLFEENNNFNQRLQLIDFNSFIAIVSYLRKEKKLEKSYEYAKIIENQFDDNLPSELKLSSIQIYLTIIDYYRYKGELEKSNNYANLILKIISEIKPTINELSDIDKKWIKEVELQTKDLILNQTKIQNRVPSISTPRKFGRNEVVKVKYKNGTIITTKYKKIKDEIDKGECIIVNF